MKTRLFEHDINFWLENEYPLTIIHDRYSGTYSGAKFLAFPRNFNEIEEEVCGSDPECWMYWHEFEDFVGRGATIQEAVSDLRFQLQMEKDSGFPSCPNFREMLISNKIAESSPAPINATERVLSKSEIDALTELLTK